jgi:predicted CXXCH cytochrome family protein
MTRIRCLGAILLGLPLLTVALAAGQRSAEVICPPAGAVLAAAPFYVIVRGGSADLTVDGKARTWAPASGLVRAARLRLEPGRHEIRVGTRALTVTVLGAHEAPTGELLRLHPIGAGKESCGTCHQTARRNDAIELGAAQPSACLACHRPAEFELKHAHPLEPLKHCASCHAPHGSAHRGLLKAPVKKLCAACHDS